jgi:hypothetical protein
MSLKGSAFLALWNDIEPAREAEYNLWHTREHVPERVSVPGIISGRRYVAATAELYRYFTLYDLEGPEVLKSPPYLALVQGPTEWSQSMRPSFRNFVRHPCALIASRGRGIGGAAATFRFSLPAGAAPLSYDVAHPVLGKLFGLQILTAVHLGAADTSQPYPIKGAREESNGQRYVLLAEANDAAQLSTVLPVLTTALTSYLGAQEPIIANTYTLAFVIDRGDLGEPATPVTRP